MKTQVALLLSVLSTTAYGQLPGPTRQAELENLLGQDCGACHGYELKGGLGPALRPSDLRGKTAQMLRSTILDGRPGTAMPPWRPLISEQDADWLAHRLLKGEAP